MISENAIRLCGGPPGAEVNSGASKNEEFDDLPPFSDSLTSFRMSPPQSHRSSRMLPQFVTFRVEEFIFLLRLSESEGRRFRGNSTTGVPPQTGILLSATDLWSSRQQRFSLHSFRERGRPPNRPRFVDLIRPRRYCFSEKQRRATYGDPAKPADQPTRRSICGSRRNCGL